VSSRVKSSVVLWRQLDTLGLEHCRLTPDAGGARIDGAAVVLDGDAPWRVAYAVRCDERWRTRHVSVQAVERASDRTLALTADADARWTVDGVARQDLAGCADVDLGFSPSTNTLAIRRLALEIGESGACDVAWVEFPSLAVRRAPQRYTRLTDRVYRFEYLAIDFTADIEVDELGLVVVYPELWERAAAR
jgi:uncharacterized protein